MKTLHIKEEGLKMNSALDFGPTAGIKNEFKYLMTTTETQFDEEFDYYYRITDNDFIQLAYSYYSSPLEIKAQYRLKYAEPVENITYAFIKLIEANWIYNGLPRFIKSDIFTEVEFKALIADIVYKRESFKKKAKKKQTEIITLLKDKNLNPIPSGNHPDNWLARCPSGGNHFIQVVTTNDKWGCGYCNRKGGINELKDWLKELGATRQQKMLSRFMQEGRKGKLSHKITTWWMNRY